MTANLRGAEPSTRRRICVTGIKPSGTPHLGNYLGAIRPALELAKASRCFIFIADYHALTTLDDPALLRSYTYDVVAIWLASGLDPGSTALFRQSAVPEVFELTWVLECFLPAAQLERGHAYKDALARGQAPNAGILNYPVLMAADILLYDADIVPVGRDQKQHVEIARDVATRLNRLFGAGTVVVPEALISEAPVVPGTDGRKMSKSYRNTIPLFAPADALRAAIMSIKTSSEPIDAPKVPTSSIVFQLYELVASASEVEAMRAALLEGGYGWRDAKEALLAALETQMAPRRALFAAHRNDERGLDEILERGAAVARRVASRTMKRVRAATGIGPTARV